MVFKPFDDLTADFYLFYLGVQGKAVKVSDGTREFFLPLSEVKFNINTPAGWMDPIRFTIPEWIAENKGLYDLRPGSLQAAATLACELLFRGDKSWRVRVGEKEAWLDKQCIKCKELNEEKKQAVITIPQWYARKKGLIE